MWVELSCHRTVRTCADGGGKETGASGVCNLFIAMGKYWKWPLSHKLLQCGSVRTYSLNSWGSSTVSPAHVNPWRSEKGILEIYGLLCCLSELENIVEGSELCLEAPLAPTCHVPFIVLISYSGTKGPLGSPQRSKGLGVIPSPITPVIPDIHINLPSTSSKY